MSRCRHRHNPLCSTVHYNLQGHTKGVLHLNSIAAASAEARSLILDALGRLVADGTFSAEPIPAFNIEIPADRAHGDFAANVAMVSAKALHMAPRKIAEAIQSALILDGSYFDKVEIAGPGFMNFYLGQRWYSEAVRAVETEKESFGRSNAGGGKRVLVEFVSANPTGPMHVGNARGGAIGDCLASVLEAAGYQAEREFYINDAGNQIEKFGKSLSLRYMQLCSDKGQAVLDETSDTEAICKRIYGENGNTEEFPMPEDVYLGQDIIAHAKNFYDENGDSFASVSEEERKNALVKFALPKNIQGLKDDLAQYRIHYDTWFPESRLHGRRQRRACHPADEGQRLYLRTGRCAVVQGGGTRC